MFGSLAVVVGVVTAAPVPKPVPVYYHPTTIGDKWTIRSSSGAVFTKVVTAVEQSGDALTVTVDFKAEGLNAPSLSRTTTVVVSESGVSDVGSQGKRYDPPFRRFKSPPTPGDVFEQVPGGRKVMIGKAEEVSVPAGKFTATPVTTEAVFPLVKRAGTPTTDITSWWAPHLGIVREVAVQNGKKLFSSELTEFTPGKPAPAARSNP